MMNSITNYLLKTSTYNTAIIIYATMPCIMVPALYLVNAPYGRFAGKFGIEFSLSGKWSWFFMEAVSPVVYTLSFLLVQPNWTQFQMILTLCWMIHYCNRSIIHPLRAPSMADVHIITSVCGFGFNLFNGYTNGIWIGRHSRSVDRVQFWIGILTWAAGFISNVYHDTVLFRLRSKTKKEESRRKYFIPQGGLYRFVSCPNYLSEAIEWIGFAIAAWPSVPALIFVFATIANLFPRAWKTHGWYKSKFESYPSSRKAVIPFLY